MKTITIPLQWQTTFLLIIAQNPTLEAIRMVVESELDRYRLGHLTIEADILRDATLRDLVQLEYPVAEVE